MKGNYRVVYPKTMDGVCAICGCRMRVTIFKCQQRTVKLYCGYPCTAGRVSPVLVLWAESWPVVRVKTPEVYIDMLRRSKGITKEAIDATRLSATP